MAEVGAALARMELTGRKVVGIMKIRELSGFGQFAIENGSEAAVKKKRRVGLATKIFVALFSVYAAVTLVSLQMSINAKKQEQERLTQELESQRLVNAELEDIIGEERNEEYIAKIARDSLDYVFPGERVFVDVSSK